MQIKSNAVNKNKIIKQNTYRKAYLTKIQYDCLKPVYSRFLISFSNFLILVSSLIYSVSLDKPRNKIFL